MGRRSGVETAVAIFAAFHRAPTWEQSELARQVGVQARTLRAALDDCVRHGMPLERDPENRSRIFWSVPAWWSRRLDDDELRTCVRLISRLPASAARDRLLERLLRGDIGPSSPVPEAERALEIIEDALRSRTALRMRYDGAVAARHASVQRIHYGERTRFVAVCHRSRSLKIFRADRVADAALDARVRYALTPPAELEAFVREAFDGFHGAESTGEYTFFVRDPEARWVVGSMPAGDVRADRVEGGVRVSVRTTARVVLARILVGLGDAARIETPSLRQSVAELARRALVAHAAGAKPLGREGERNSAPRSSIRGSRHDVGATSSFLPAPVGSFRRRG